MKKTIAQNMIAMSIGILLISAPVWQYCQNVAEGMHADKYCIQHKEVMICNQNTIDNKS